MEDEMLKPMSRFLTEDADLIYACISGLERDTQTPSCPGVKPLKQNTLNQLVSELPPDRFTEAVRFLVRMNMAVLIPNGVCSCGSTRFDVVPNFDSYHPPSQQPRDHDQ
jgi:hypothetical protein